MIPFSVILNLLLILLSTEIEESSTESNTDFINYKNDYIYNNEIQRRKNSNNFTTASYYMKNESTPMTSDGLSFNVNKTNSYHIIKDPLEITEPRNRRLVEKSGNIFENQIFLGISMTIIYSGIIISTLLRNAILIGTQAVLLLYGIIVGLFFRSITAENTEANIFPYQRYILIYIAVPLMLYRACITSDFHRLKKNLVRSLIISVPGLLINAILVGIAMRYLMETNWNFMTYTFFGTACVFIYPKEIIEIMKELDSQSQQIAVLLEGELIIGTIFVFALNVIWFGGHLVTMSTYEIFLNILRYLSGILIGLVAGLVNCYFFWIFSSNVIDLFLFATIFPLLVFYICFDLVRASGIVAISICGLVLASDRIVLNKRSKIIIRHSWKFFSTLIDSALLTGMGFFIAWNYVWYSDVDDYVYIVLLYCIIYFGRFIVLTILSPLTNKLGFTMDARCRIVAVCGGVPSLMNIAFAMLPSSIEYIEEVRSTMFFYITGVVIISLLLNVICLPYLISFLKLDVVSSSRENDLRSCVRYLRRLKYKELLFMKIESLMGETDWARVQSISHIENPFNKELSIREEETDQTIRFCPECHNELPVFSNFVGYPNQREVTNFRLLKAREAMQIQMFSKDLLSSRSFIVLNEILKEAHNHPNYCLNSDYLVKKFDVELICAKSCQRVYHTLPLFRFKPNQIRPPNFYWRRLCYHLMENKVFHIVTAGIILLNMVFVITEGFINPEPRSDVKYAFTFFDVVFLIFFTSEWLINIAGRARATFWKTGFMDYLRSPFNIFDFFILITVWTSFIIETSCYMNQSSEIFLYDNRLWFTVFKSLRILRIIRFLKYTQSIASKMVQYYQSQRLLTAFDVGKDFLIQERRMMSILPNICGHYKICRDLEEDIEETLQGVVREIYNVQSNFSWISTTVKTKHATKLVINSMKDTADHLLVSGWIENTEYNSLISMLNSMSEKVDRRRKIETTNRENIFGNVSWLQGHPNTKNALLEKAEIRLLESGKCIFQEGDKSNGIYIIVAGVCDISYIPQEETLSRLNSHGELPVVDNILSGNFEKRINTYVTSGMTIGELSFLTDRAYASNVTADSPCEAYFLSSEVLHEVMQVDSDLDDGLECRIWKSVSKNMATGLLLRLTKFDFEETLLHERYLTRFYVPTINQYEYLKVNNFVKDIVLIEGVITDEITGNCYTAPCRISRNH